MKKIIFKLIVLAVLLVFANVLCFSHPGKTDKDGGHKDKNNVSGLGEYHYHHGNEAHLHPDGVCSFELEDGKSVENKKIEKTGNN